MADYQFYVLDGAGHILIKSSAECTDDGDAFDKAAATLGAASRIEIWQDDRCLAQLSSKSSRAALSSAA